MCTNPVSKVCGQRKDHDKLSIINCCSQQHQQEFSSCLHSNFPLRLPYLLLFLLGAVHRKIKGGCFLLISLSPLSLSQVSNSKFVSSMTISYQKKYIFYCRGSTHLMMMMMMANILLQGICRKLILILNLLLRKKFHKKVNNNLSLSNFVC